MLMELRHPNVLEFVGWNSIECLLVTELMRKGSLYTPMHMSIRLCKPMKTHLQACVACACSELI